jgi:hypothetical protein
MRMTYRLALLAAFAVGCAETATAPPGDKLQRSQSVSNYVEEGDQNPPADVPAEYNFPTILYSVEPDAGFVDGYAYAQSIVRYFGTNALARATVNTNVGSETGESETSELLPANRSHVASTNYYMGSCGGNIQGTAYGKVWNEFPIWGSFLNWGAKSDTRQTSATCPTSSPSPSPGGGGGGGGGTCWTLTIDHYWYYPDTGEIEYWYSESYTWCEAMT